MTIVTTQLESNVQLDIDALTVASTPKEILTVAVAAKDLPVDTTNLELVLNAAIAASDSSTVEKDLVTLNAARIALESEGGSGDTLPQLSENLSYPSSIYSGYGLHRILIPDTALGLTTALDLSGSFSIDHLRFGNVVSGQVTIKLTIDGDIIWNDTYSAAATDIFLIGAVYVINVYTGTSSRFKCKTSMKLEIQTTSNANVVLYYLVTPIK